MGWGLVIIKRAKVLANWRGIEMTGIGCSGTTERVVVKVSCVGVGGSKVIRL